MQLHEKAKSTKKLKIIQKLDEQHFSRNLMEG